MDRISKVFKPLLLTVLLLGAFWLYREQVLPTLRPGGDASSNTPVQLEQENRHFSTAEEMRYGGEILEFQLL